MSIFQSMYTSISGMNAQANMMSAIANNIANSGTVGYKEQGEQFETMVGNPLPSQYESGGVLTVNRANVLKQGVLTTTSSPTDLAINGNGFFIVNSANTGDVLTRAGNFVQDANNNLVNAAGFTLMGYKVTPGVPTNTTVGLGSLVPVNISTNALQAIPSTAGTFTANLPSTATAINAAKLPSTNNASASYTAKSSVTAYDNLGGKVPLDVYFSNTGTGTWEMSIYNANTASASGGFPYSSGALVTQTLTFNQTNGSLVTPASPVSIPIPNGNNVTLDLSKTTQFNAAYAVTSATMDGTAPSALNKITVGADGTVYSVYQNGAQVADYVIPLATVPSPDSLTALSGNVYQVNQNSGPILTGSATTSGFGSIAASSLESSTVDLANELPNMIATQRNYSANSQAFQASAQLAEILVNMKL